jgi:hypothetical protein
MEDVVGIRFDFVLGARLWPRLVSRNSTRLYCLVAIEGGEPLFHSTVAVQVGYGKWIAPGMSLILKVHAEVVTVPGG